VLHPTATLIAYLKGELTKRGQQDVVDHLDACPKCTQIAEDFQEILRALGQSVPNPPEIDWQAYRLELREKLDARRTRTMRGQSAQQRTSS